MHHTTRSSVTIALLFALMFGRGTFALFAEEPAVNLVPVLKINKEYDQRTVVKPSMIPNAGNGLFALTPIKRGGKSSASWEAGWSRPKTIPRGTIMWPPFQNAPGRKLIRTNISIAKISAAM